MDQGDILNRFHLQENVCVKVERVLLLKKFQAVQVLRGLHLERHVVEGPGEGGQAYQN